MAKILKFPKVPELDWLKELVDNVDDSDWDGAKYTSRLEALYKYLLWSRRYQLVHAQYNRDEYDVSYGFLLKNHRIMMGMDIPPHEQELIDRAEARLKESNEEIRRRKAAK